MAIFRNITTLAFIATASAAMADEYPDYRAQQQAADAQFQQATTAQNAVNQARSMDNPVPTYQPVYQSSYTGAEYTNPGYTGAGYTGQTGYGQK